MNSQFKDSEFPLKKHEVEKLINGAKNFRDKVLIESLYCAALRRFEAAKLDIRNIDFEKGRITVYGKFGKVSVIPVGAVFPQFMTDLRLFIGTRKEGYIFESNREKTFELSRINQILTETAEKVGIKNPNPKKKHINPHCLRHSIARHLKDDGYSNEFVKNYLRHKSIQTTMDEYGTLSIDEMEKFSENKKVNPNYKQTNSFS